MSYRDNDNDTSGSFSLRRNPSRHGGFGWRLGIGQTARRASPRLGTRSVSRIIDR
ncbi:hypothetical protein HFO65_11935 [Rhizobium laguerreae]|uniref:hypothetical protein n=1 Tax=Rhizobium laguerreae TaxID=1076926 RepID=UPI00143F35FF|nr:hypothetical protein [Rhizobium laguerreae]MBY3072096.1 hypothetical protein [Rhizobium laguerreae]MBY3091335.1 hypothetical protein [Rhizobium laguerreae]MBY3123581.1 hypothetical protein [Rhizobium laguerreae]MBY3138890.1 hypothetical protein [Rhizobium laguerreae]MBY3161344.1 hypothetical protein [Rhizobium laguerreae]